MENPRALERFELLREKVEQAAARVSELSLEAKALQQEKADLKREITELKMTNGQLTDEITELESLNEERNKQFDKEEVRKKIDRMLEKFSELQL